MAQSVVSFVTEEMYSSEVHSDAVGVSPPTVAAAMGNQQIRAQVGYYTTGYIGCKNISWWLILDAYWNRGKRSMHMFHDKCKELKKLMHLIYVMSCGTW